LHFWKFLLKNWFSFQLRLLIGKQIKIKW